MDLSHTTLYSGTVFTLSCLVTLVEEVDTTVSVTITWSKGQSVVSTERGQMGGSNTHVYETHLPFNPLTTSDSELYSCSVDIESDEFLSGIFTRATQAITVKS